MSPSYGCAGLRLVRVSVPKNVRLPRSLEEMSEQEARYQVALLLRRHPEFDAAILELRAASFSWVEILAELNQRLNSSHC